MRVCAPLALGPLALVRVSPKRVPPTLARVSLALAPVSLALARVSLALARATLMWWTRPTRVRATPAPRAQTRLRARQLRGRVRQRPRVQQRPLQVRRAALARVPVSAVQTLPVLVLVEPTWQVAPVRPTRAGPVPERQRGGTERGASSRPEAWPASWAPEAWPASRAPEAGRASSGGQLRRPTKPPPAEPGRRCQWHGRACGLGLESAQLESGQQKSAQLESGQREACVPDRLRAPSGARRRTPCWPRALGWPTPVHDRRPARARDWLLGTHRLPETRRLLGTRRRPGTGSAEGPGEGAATG